MSALYENPFNSSVVDSIFNDFKIHVNSEYNYQIEYKKIIIRVANDVPWIEDFKNTGISGIPALDNLMAQYQLSIFNYIVLPTCECTHFHLETNFDFLNMYALIDDFEAIETIDRATVNISDMSVRFNYTGIPYYIDNRPIEVCDIIVDGDLFTFILYAYDCMAGCLLQEARYARVTEECEVLSTPSNSFEKLVIYPNPTSNKIYLRGISSDVEHIQIFSVEGKLVQSLENVSQEIDVSQLNPGIYFMQVITSEADKYSLKFIRE
ncbi:T9SS type A sorting domain-containing protein [Aequorivita sp. H23M31]|uniref:T9SS type A sorting domain-containing protein n=1 Tax=Aequorivita ciconiae TaxID=2494375 RepID=A0A410G4W1_9FLAO|nr:T9SS type A sorting domain-containing protein [Aequorivita sp. H23M31]QAA82313.1 T9SS type A sorting domain-containing protein [Aequorivita sp. H23M31]